MPNPLLTSPSTFADGTRRSSNWISVAYRADRSVCITRRTWNPGASVSTMKQVIPSRPPSLSVRANVIPKSARSAPLMNCLVPLRIQSSPSRRAVVWIAPAGSLPPEGSVNAKKLRFSPFRTGYR